MELEIISPEGYIYQGETDRVSLPGAKGRFEVLPRHAPLITLLQKGVIIYHVKGTEEKKEIDGGFVEIRNDRLSVCIE